MLDSNIAQLANLASIGILWFLFVISFFSVALFIERILFYKKIFLKKNDYSELYNIKTKKELFQYFEKSQSIEEKIVSKALKQTNLENSEKFKASVLAEISIEKPKWEKYHTFFASVGSNSAFLGLLGTVLGLMQSFSDLALSSHPEAKVAMNGISNALITTVAGILVAVPTVIFYNFFKKRIKDAISRIEFFVNLIISKDL